MRASTHKCLKRHQVTIIERVHVYAFVCLCRTDLCMDKSIIKKDEPVDREPSSVLQRQSFVATLADEAAVSLS